ncbi:hypothetical protein G9A89_019121 [Geosiphon pyriformis]|nr:hypothetical protein G9A89_019121 [Geosiphon pyriformis]
MSLRIASKALLNISFPVQTTKKFLIILRSLNSGGKQILHKSPIKKSSFPSKINWDSSRYYTQTPKNVKSETSSRQRYAMGPTTWRSLALFIATGVGLVLYFRNEKEKLEKKRKEDREMKSIGRPKIGGSFDLLDQNGQVFTDHDLLGRYSLIYFGFTNCPDICPEELDKMTAVIDKLSKCAQNLPNHRQLKQSDPDLGDIIRPIFISCDPQRDSVEAVREYLKDFHKDFIGLTGTFDQVAKVAKAYRMYFSRPPQVKDGEDYLVDHSIFFYLMDPNGEFVSVYGKQALTEEIYKAIKDHILEFLSQGGKFKSADSEKKDIEEKSSNEGGKS